MDFQLSEEQNQIKALIRDFCKREVDDKRLWEIAQTAATSNVEELRANMPWDLVEKSHEVGLRQLAVPEKYGGGGFGLGGWLTRTLAAEEAGYSGGQFGRLMTIPWKFCGDIDSCASEEQKDWFFKRFMENHRMYVAASISEPEGMTDISLPYDEPGVAMKTHAYKDGNEWVINGDKMWCSAGAVADLILVSARTDKKGPISKSMTQFWVESDQPGIEMELNRIMVADMTGNVQIHLDNVRVPEDHVMGEINEAWEVMHSRLGAKMIHFASHIGRTQKMYEQIMDYAKERIQGGKPIIQHPNVAALLAEAAVNLEATRALFYKAAWECDQEEKATGRGTVNPKWGDFCNYYYKKMTIRFCEIGVEILGGMSVSKDFPFERFVRSAWARLHGGSTPMTNLIKCAPYL